jgi:hypothetical protein
LVRPPHPPLPFPHQSVIRGLDRRDLRLGGGSFRQGLGAGLDAKGEEQVLLRDGAVDGDLRGCGLVWLLWD